MKILWWSPAPWVPTGYGQPTGLFVQALREHGHDVRIAAHCGLSGAEMQWRGVHVIPCEGLMFGVDTVRAYAKRWGADLVMFFGDVWAMFGPGWEQDFADLRLAAWLPIDTEPIADPILERCKWLQHPIVYTAAGQAAAKAKGVHVEYIPIGIDTQVFTPGDMRETRRKRGLPEEAFIVGIVAANKGYPSRKAFPEQFAGFARFKQRHPDALLYVHTQDLGDNGANNVDLVKLCEVTGLRPGVDVVFTSTQLQALGCTPEWMAELYRCFDVLLGVTMSEGFGIPLVEAQACGVPVIVGDWTGMAELCFAGWKVPRDEALPFYTPLGAYHYLPRATAIRDRLALAYKRRGDMRLAAQAREGAVDYDYREITERYWLPLLERIAGERRAA